jgi:hypothetical protein
MSHTTTTTSWQTSRLLAHGPVRRRLHTQKPTRYRNRSAARHAQFVSSILRMVTMYACSRAKESMSSIRRASTLGFLSCPVRVRSAGTVRSKILASSLLSPVYLRGEADAFFLADFQALETLLAGGKPTERRASQPPRFSRYLRFARRHHRHRIGGEDLTDPSYTAGFRTGPRVMRRYLLEERIMRSRELRR